MTQDEIIEMARQAKLGFLLESGFMCHQEVKDFAKLVAEKEREACAALRTTIWCPDATVKAAVDSALDFYSERILARKEVGDVNPE